MRPPTNASNSNNISTGASSTAAAAAASDDFERMVATATRMTVNNASDDSDLSDISDELNSSARIPAVAAAASTAIRQIHPGNSAAFAPNAIYVPNPAPTPAQSAARGGPNMLPFSPSRGASLMHPPGGASVPPQGGRLPSQQTSLNRNDPLVSAGKRPDFQLPPMSNFAPLQPPAVPDLTRAQKRLSSSSDKRLSLDFSNKRASLEMKIHDGMIIVDEEERLRLARKTNASAVINHPPVQNHQHQQPIATQNVRMPATGPSVAQQPTMPESRRPATSAAQLISPSGSMNAMYRPQPPPASQAPQRVSFQGPPRAGSLSTPPPFARPPPPVMMNPPSNPPPPLMYQQQQFNSQPMQPASPMQPIQPNAPRPYAPGSVPLPSKLPDGRNAQQYIPPSQFHPQQPLYSPQAQQYSPQSHLYSPPSQQNSPQMYQQPQQSIPFQRQPPMILDQLQQQTWANSPSSSPGSTPPVNMSSKDAFAAPPMSESSHFEKDLNDDADSESDVSFVSFDDETEDNTEYNAILDYDLLDMIMNGSTDYLAPMPRVQHTRKVVFNQLVKAQTLVRVRKEGEPDVESPGALTEPEDRDGSELEEEEEEDETDSEDDVPPSPVLEVVGMIPLRPPDSDMPPEIAPRGISLTKMGPAEDATPTGATKNAPIPSPANIPAELSIVPPPPKKDSPIPKVPLSIPPPPIISPPIIPPTSVPPSFSATPQFSAPAATSSLAAIAQASMQAASTLSPAVSPEDSPNTSTPIAQKQAAKKRHVQIQTRGATMKHQTTMTEISGDPFEQPRTVTGPGGSVVTTVAAGVQADIDDPKVSEMAAEIEFLQAQNHALQEQVAQMQTEATVRMTEMEDVREKFDRVSGQASRKIRELIGERKVLEVEIEGLRGQVSGLEKLLEKWTIEDD